MMRDEILEYPYCGRVIRVHAGHGDEDDTYEVIYKGVMDLTLREKEIAHTMQTATYVVSMPLVRDASCEYVIPHKDDWIEMMRYGERLTFEVDNAEPSQLGGVTCHVVRKDWDYNGEAFPCDCT